jgi:hypothetical protein
MTDALAKALIDVWQRLNLPREDRAFADERVATFRAETTIVEDEPKLLPRWRYRPG